MIALMRIVMAVVLVMAIIGSGAGFAVADHDTENENCEGLHTADDETDDTEGDGTVEHTHDECHGNTDG